MREGSVGNLFLFFSEFHYDDVTVTSAIVIIYGQTAIESIVQGTTFCYSFLWPKSINQSIKNLKTRHM